MPGTTLAKVLYWHTSGFLELRSQFGQLSLTKVLKSALKLLIDLGQQGIVLSYSFFKNVLSGNRLEAIAHSWQYTELCETVPPYRKWDASPHPTGHWETCTSKVYHGCFWVSWKKNIACSCSTTKEALHRSRPCIGHSKGIKAMQRQY